MVHQTAGGSANKHKRSHICPRCGKSFLRAEHMQRHVLSHEKKKPHACTACGAKYGRADVLLRHKRKCLQLQTNTSMAEYPSGSSPYRVDGELDTYPLSANQAAGPDASVEALLDAAEVLNDQQYPANPDSEPSYQTQGLLHQPAPLSSSRIGVLQTQAKQNMPSRTNNHGGRRNHALQSDFNMQPTIEGFGFDSTNENINQALSETVTVASNGNSISSNAIDFSDFQLDGEAFLEDTFLFQFAYNPSGLTIPSTPSAGLGLSNFHTTSDAPLQLATPESVSMPRSRAIPQNTLQISQNELKVFYAKLNAMDSSGGLRQFRRPSLSRTLRCLIAYFRHFDPHTPIIHFALFKISETHPALVLIMLAIGAIHLSETQFAYAAYEASCLLVAQHEQQKIENQDSSFDLWHAQTTCLCSQFGACTGDNNLFIRAQRHLFMTQTLLYRAVNEVREYRESDDWSSWILMESLSRLISWMFVVSAMCLSFDPLSMSIIPPVPEPIPCPCDESTWHAVTEAEWKAARQMDSATGSVDLWTLSRDVFNGQTIEEGTRISAFTLLALIGSFQCSICTRLRLSLDIYDPSDTVYVAQIEKALGTWEGLWRRHPRAEQTLLSSAYYHLYIGKQLVTLKRIAENPSHGLTLPACDDKSKVHKVIKYAANSWLVRAKIGITYLSKTGALDLGSQALSTVYESALILAWWLHLQGDKVWHPEAQTYDTEEDRAAACAATRLFGDILNELDEQDRCSSQPHQSKLDPIEFYSCLCEGLVWKRSSVVQQRLRQFESHLRQLY